MDKGVTMPDEEKKPELTEAEKKILNAKMAEFQKKMSYLENKLHIQMRAVLERNDTISSETVRAKLVMAAKPDFFKTFGKKIIQPKGLIVSKRVVPPIKEM